MKNWILNWYTNLCNYSFSDEFDFPKNISQVKEHFQKQQLLLAFLYVNTWNIYRQ